MPSQPIKGRGAQKQVHNKFFEHRHDTLDEYLNFCEVEGETADTNKTKYIEVFPKTFVNKVESPDIGMGYSANPYQGCEHGCVYCYARNSHEYWGYGAGLDFERNILVKKNAPQLLEETLQRKNWQGDTIVFSGNTDCYQPIERKLEITRECLKRMFQWKNPTGIITKNALILRDLDILKEMAKYQTIVVSISITSLKESTRRLLEPRTSSIQNRLKAVEILSSHNIPVNVMIAPVIPSLNSHEILPLIEKVASLGAQSVAHTVVRLNGQIATIFEDWVRKTLPDRADRILHQIAECHDGKLNDSRWGKRIKGEGIVAQQIADTMALGKKRFLSGRKIAPMDRSHYLQLKDPQMKLF
ncbi:MAG TPA: PA0069 family radical SAM protein [Flavobacteriaceae bacterium]|nr:PA0069 family radical SAM protein [Flavobacteriaceae bacterium]MCB9212082.1 PA0069 family radical SAM protein [Alteromonas sp.]HPF09822.1 PA0069 family radical SAM protein [Flavobacteriaceae bacterium]HQU22026.1 PA0069 family radical SAM protein [Flavobacteriaceae bacterium]HQU64093.1 PA0069 family radical SAM protein [Flavobacteriaceae bacterium]